MNGVVFHLMCDNYNYPQKLDSLLSYNLMFKYFQ